jgi:hypothetical protein
LGLTFALVAMLPSVAHAITTPPTIAKNTFASTPVGQSLNQTVTLTLTSASAIKSIALATGTSASNEYTLTSVSGCAVDGTTVNASGTVCSLSVKYTPLSPGSLASPGLSRNAQLLYTDGASNVTAYGLSGAATKAISHVVPGTISLYAGQPYTATGTSPLDNGLGQVNGGYAGNGVAATAATFQFAPFNAILSQDYPSNGSEPLAFDSQGNLYVIDGPNFVIRKIDNSSSHLVTTVAGTPSAQGYTGNGGAATSAKLNNPRSITLDAAGNIYFLDQTTVSFFGYPAYVIRRIDAVTGIITAVAGENFTGTYDTADGGGTCDLNNAGSYAIYSCGDGGLATYAYLNTPYNLALDSQGNFYLWGGNYSLPPYLRKITASTGIISTIGNETNLNSIEMFGGMTLGSDGNLYVLTIDKTSNTLEIKQLNPTTQAVTSLAGSNGVFSGCAFPATQQLGFPAANLALANGVEATLGDLSADASGNLYVDANLCTNGAISVSNFPPSIIRVNIASKTAYDEVVADAYPYGGTQSIGYNAFYFYAISPVSPVSDNAGNIFFTSYNQIAELSGQSAELDYTDRYDFTTSAAQTATYANLGNESTVPPTYTFHSGTNFVLLETGDTNACDALTSVAGGGACDLDVAFAPTAAGALTDNLNVSGGDSTETVTVDGTGLAAAQLGVSPTALDFGNQTLDVASAFKTFTLTDTGTANLTIENFFPDGTNGFANYEVVANGGTCGTSASTVLTPGSSCTVEITFTPSKLGSLPANFYVNTSISFGDVATLNGTGAAAPATVTETGNLWFNPAPVAIAAASAQTLTATFTIKGLATAITPTATMHYGLAYKVGAVACTGAAGNQTCTVPVTFIPNLPGGRKDALFLMNGTTRLATQLAYGIGNSPFALIQPGVITQPILNGPQYYYDSTVDENGTAYVVEQENNAILSVTAAGVVTTLPITGLTSPRGVAIDGAGILYVADQKLYSVYTTYDTVQGIQASVTDTTIASNVQDLATGNEGNLYATDETSIFTITPNGTTTSTPITPQNIQANRLTVDDKEDVFIGGAKINEIPFGGTQVQVNTVGAGDGLSVDAALTLYACRYNNGSDSVGELPPPGYSAAQAELDYSANPLGCSDGPDGTLWVGNYTDLDKVDRSQGAPIVFGEQGNGSPSQPASFSIYNGGNENLTLATFAVTGEGFAIQTGTTNACSAGLVIAPGALCNAPVVFTGTHSGKFTGTISYSSDTLNTTATAGTVALSAYINGIYVTVAPSPLDFGNQTVGTTSATKTVTLTNNGVNANFGGFNVLPSSVAGFNITQGTCGGKIAPGDSCSFDVTFSPTAPQPYTGTSNFTASSDASTQTQTVSFVLNGTGVPAVTPPTVTETGNLWFNPAPVAISLASAQTLTATFSITGYATSLTPTAKMHYGLSYKVGAVTCTGSTGNQTCTVPVTFVPEYPGGRRDALFLMNGTTRLATVLAYGIGQGPFALLQPGIVSTPVTNAASYLYASVVDDSGTVYNAQQEGSDILQVTAAGVSSMLPITGLNSPRGIGIDGAGVLYISDQKANSALTTYDTVQGIQGTFPWPTPAPLYMQAVAVGNEGAIYESDFSNIYIFAAGSTTATTVPIDPAITQPSYTTVDSSENLVLLGYTVNELTHGGTQTQIATHGQGYGIAADAADTLYYPTTTATVGQYPATNYNTNEGTLDPASDPLSVTPGSDGKLYVSNFTNLDVVDRSQGAIDFGAQQGGTASALQNIQLYNGGNETLTISNMTTTGAAAFTLVAPTTTPCSSGLSIAPGALCQIQVQFLSAVPGSFTGDLVFTTNSLNTTATTQTVTLAATISGAYMVASPVALDFGTVTDNTTSPAKTITLTNNGYGDAAQVYPLTPSDTAFTVTSGTCTGNIAVGSSCNLDVTFSPTMVKGYSATDSAQIANVGSGTNPPNVNFTFAGSGAAAAAPAASLSPTSLTFPATNVNTTSTAMSTTLSNTGTATLNISGITLTGANTGDFAETTTCGTTLAAGKTCSISVTFTPASPTTFTASISVADDAAGSPQTATLSGTGTPAPAPIASLSPTAISFPSTAVGSTATAISTTLSNTGNAVLNVSGITLIGTNTADFAKTTTCGATLAAGKTCSISVTFTPASPTTFMASLSVADDAPGSPQTATLSGTGTPAPAPIASLSPTAISFPNTAVGSTATAISTTLSNTGNAVLNISGITLAGANTADFAETTTCGATLAAGKTCTVSVTFTPASPTTFTASISVADDAAGSPQTATLSGTGTPAPAPIASLSPTAISFPNTAVGSTATAVSTTLSNTGNAVLNISGITLTGANTADFAETTTCGTTLAAGKTCTVSVTFTPASATSFTASVSVADDAAGSPQTATLSGTGTPAPAPIASLSPTAISFPNTAVGSTATAISTTLSNTGNAVLNISGITLTGANPTDFAITTSDSACGSSLAAGSTCTISVTFTPAAASNFTASISVADNAAGSPQIATLSGTGNPPLANDFSLTVTPPAKTVAPGGLVQFNVATTGIGGSFDSAIQLTATGLPGGFTATFAPASVTPGSNGASSVLSIQTTSLSALSQPHPLHRGPWVPASLAALLVIPLLGLRKRFSKLGGIARNLSFVLLLAGSLAPVLLLTGCSGGFYGPQNQTYTVTVVGTSGSTQHSTTVTVTVQE